MAKQELDKKIGKYWSHYVKMYIDAGKQQQAMQLDINQIKERLIKLVLYKPEITYDFISFILTNIPQNYDYYNTICLEFLKQMKQNTVENIATFTKYHSAYIEYKRAFLEDLGRCSLTTVNTMEIPKKKKKECEILYNEKIKQLEESNLYGDSTIEDIIQFGVEYSSSHMFNEANFKKLLLNILKNVEFWDNDGEIIIYIIDKFKDKTGLQGLLKEIILYYLEDMAQQTELIGRDCILKRCIRDDQLSKESATIFENKFQPYKYLKMTKIEADLFANKFVNIIKFDNEINENILEIINIIRAELLANTSDILNTTTNNVVNSLVQSIKTNQVKVSNISKSFPKLKDLNKNHNNIIITSEETILGAYKHQHVDIAHYASTVGNDNRIVFNKLDLGVAENNALSVAQTEKEAYNAKTQPIYNVNFGNRTINNVNLATICLGKDEGTDGHAVLKCIEEDQITIYRRASEIKNDLPLFESGLLQCIQTLYKNSPEAKLYHGDVVCFGKPNIGDLQNDAIYQLRCANPIFMRLCKNMLCSVTSVKSMVEALYTLDPTLSTHYAKFISEGYFVNVTHKGGNNSYVTIAGRRRKIVMQKGKKYVKFHSELVLLSKLEGKIKGGKTGKNMH